MNYTDQTKNRLSDNESITMVRKHLAGQHDQKRYGTIGAGQARFVHATLGKNLQDILRYGLRQGTYLLDVEETDEMNKINQEGEGEPGYAWYDDQFASNQHVMAATEQAVMTGTVDTSTVIDVIAVDITKDTRLDYDKDTRLDTRLDYDDEMTDWAAAYVTLDPIAPEHIQSVHRYRFTSEGSNLLNSLYKGTRIKPTASFTSFGALKKQQGIDKSNRLAAINAWGKATKALEGKYGVDDAYNHMFSDEGVVYNRVEKALDAKRRMLAVVTDYVPVVEKHLPGRHNQQNHAGQEISARPIQPIADFGSALIGKEVYHARPMSLYGQPEGRGTVCYEITGVDKTKNISTALDKGINPFYAEAASKFIYSLDNGKVYGTTNGIHADLMAAAHTNNAIHFTYYQGKFNFYSDIGMNLWGEPEEKRSMIKRQKISKALSEIHQTTEALYKLGFPDNTQISVKAMYDYGYDKYEGPMGGFSPEELKSMPNQKVPNDGKKPILVLDFDGVCHLEDKYTYDTDIPGVPTDGLFAALLSYQKVFDVNIFSTRSKTAAGRKAIKNWFDKEYQLWQQHEGVRAALILSYPESKPPAFISMDDRGINFGGMWPDVNYLKNFKPWHESAGRDKVEMKHLPGQHNQHTHAGLSTQEQHSHPLNEWNGALHGRLVYNGPSLYHHSHAVQIYEITDVNPRVDLERALDMGTNPLTGEAASKFAYNPRNGRLYGTTNAIHADMTHFAAKAHAVDMTYTGGQMEFFYDAAGLNEYEPSAVSTKNAAYRAQAKRNIIDACNGLRRIGFPDYMKMSIYSSIKNPEEDEYNVYLLKSKFKELVKFDLPQIAL